MPNIRLHDVKEGETLQDLSARYYGLPSEYQRIVNANPEVATNFYEIFPGQLLVIPEKESLNTSGTTIETGDDDVVIGIDGVIYSNFTGFSLKRSIKDAADVFAFEIPWNNPTEAQKKTFMPFSYNFVQIFIGSVLRFTGTLINVLPNVSTKEKKLSISGYSTCGVLNDCNFPTSAYPLVFKTSTLFDICKTLANPFNVKVVDEIFDDYSFEEVDIKQTDKVYSFLSKLAKKRGVLLASDNNGNLVLQKASDKKATFGFKEGEPDILSIAPNYNGQSGYSTFTGVLDIKDTDAKPGADAATVRDDFMFQHVVRPFVFKIDEIDEGNITVAAEAKMRRSWAKRISYNVTMKGWKDPKGKLWKENIRFNLFYPSVMIYKTTEFLVAEVDLLLTDSKKVTTMILVLPQSYNDEELETLPWIITE